MKFSANISTLFREHDIVDRVKEAKKCGFEAIEVQFPYGNDYENLPQTIMNEDIKVVLINSYTGEGNDFGSCCIPGEEIRFLTDISKSLSVLFQLKCPKLHILAGMKSNNFTAEEQTDAYIRNLQAAADVLEEHNVMGLIEPICSTVKENYFLDSFEKAIRILEDVNKENIKLLLDIYHLKVISGNVMDNLPKLYPYAGHIQISQDPGRTEPFAAGGNINYNDVFKFLKEKDHQDFIGLEYFPTKSTKMSLDWMKNFV